MSRSASMSGKTLKNAVNQIGAPLLPEQCNLFSPSFVLFCFLLCQGTPGAQVPGSSKCYSIQRTCNCWELHFRRETASSSQPLCDGANPAAYDMTIFLHIISEQQQATLSYLSTPKFGIRTESLLSLFLRALRGLRGYDPRDHEHVFTNALQAKPGCGHKESQDNQKDISHAFCWAVYIFILQWLIAEINLIIKTQRKWQK